MTSQLSDEEFRRLQTQLIELRTANYGLEEQCMKYKSDNRALSTKLGALERECQKVQKSVDRSKKAKDIDILLNENENLQVKLEAQEDDFRLQNQTLLWELSALTAANEKLEQELAVLKTLNDTASATENSTQAEREGHNLLVEQTVLTSDLVKDYRKAEETLEELRTILQSVSTADSKQIAYAEQGNSIRSSGGDLIQVDKTDVAYQKQGISQADLLKEVEQKFQYLEGYQKNIKGFLTHFKVEKEEKKQVQSEMKQLQDKLNRKQECLLQLQEEKEKIYTESREAYKQLQREKEQEVGMLKEQNQRLQVQLNNIQVSLHDLKEKSSQHIRELESHVSLLERKNESTSKEHLMEIQAKVMELEYVLNETKESLNFVQQQKSQLESQLADTCENLNQKQKLLSAMQEQKTRLSSALDEASLIAQKRKNLVDEMSIRIQQKSDDYKHQLSNLTNEFNNKEEELKKKIEAFQEEVQTLAPLQSQLDDALVQVKSLEAMKVWLECQQKETEGRIKSTEIYYEDAIEHLKAEHDKELSQLKLFYENHDKVLQEELESLQSEVQKRDEDLSRLEQQLRDAEEEKQLAERKGNAVMKDLRRQLAAERKRSEKLQERMRDLLNEGTHIKTDVNKSLDPESSSISSWSLMSGNCEPRVSGTRENSIVAGSISNFNGNISPPPEDQDLEQENYRLLSRITDLQQEKWVLEEKINHLEQGSAAMAEDLMHKTALIQYYCIEGKSGPVATSTSSSSSSPSNERLSVKKFVEKLKGDEHVHESNRRMQRMLEEMLTKNMHLQTSLEQLSLEVVRLRKGTDSNICT